MEGSSQTPYLSSQDTQEFFYPKVQGVRWKPFSSVCLEWTVHSSQCEVKEEEESNLGCISRPTQVAYSGLRLQLPSGQNPKGELQTSG